MFNERLMILTRKKGKRTKFFFSASFYKSCWMIFVFCWMTYSMYAQKGLTIEPTLHVGAVTKHTPKLTFDVKGASVGADVNFKFQTFGKKEWHQWRNFPLLGVSTFWMRFGNEKVLGQAFAVAPNLTIPLFEKKKWKGFYQIGSGIAYMTRKYEVVDNPKNNAIGANRVSTILMKFYLARQLNSNWKIHTGVSLNHFSNGGARLPNFGINVPAWMMSVSYTPEPLEQKDFIFHEKSRMRNRKFGIDAHAGFGLVQRFAIGGPRYPIYIFSLGGNYYLNRVNRIVAGFEYEQNKAIYNFALHTSNSKTGEDAWKKASRLTFFLGDEFLFGSWSITLQVGVYLGKFSFLKSGTTYTKFSTRYYFPINGFFKNKIFLNVSLKTHLTVAEYISVGGGMNF